MPVIPGESYIKLTPTEGGDYSTTNQDYFDYGTARGIYDRLIDGWKTIIDETERQRALRYIKDAESEELRKSGILKADELYSPVRLIDSNIRAEQPPTLAYICQSRRSIIFASPDGEPVNGVEKLEQDFTTKARYLGWELPFIEVTDGATAHGWDAVEILFDSDTPSNFVFEHIGHDSLIFSVDCEDIESQEVIAIRKILTPKQLRSLIKEGFDRNQVEKIIAKSGKGVSGTVDTGVEVFKIFFKKENIVHVCWHNRLCDGYLRAPAPLFLGIRDFTQPRVLVDPQNPLNTDKDYPPIFETEYPVIINKYIISSDPRIVELKGRVKLDEASQEAASAIQSGLVNGVLRAANIYAAPAASNINSNPNSSPAQTNVVLANGAIYDQPLTFFNTPYPDSSVIQALQTVVMQNKQEQGGGIDLASLNRKDSGKTATEIQRATQKSTELTSVQVILLSIFIRLCYAKAWRIYQNRVLQGAIVIRDPYLVQLFGIGIQWNQITGTVDSCKAAKQYIIKSSGDVDVVQRQERLQKLMQGWEVFGKTPIANEYLKDILRNAFPEDASRYIEIMEQAELDKINQLKQLLMKTSGVAVALAQGTPIQGNEQSLQQLQQEVMQALQAP